MRLPVIRVFWRKLQLAEAWEPSRASLTKPPALHTRVPTTTNGGVVKWKNQAGDVKRPLTLPLATVRSGSWGKENLLLLPEAPPDSDRSRLRNKVLHMV